MHAWQNISSNIISLLLVLLNKKKQTAGIGKYLTVSVGEGATPAWPGLASPLVSVNIVLWNVLRWLQLRMYEYVRMLAFDVKQIPS